MVCTWYIRALILSCTRCFTGIEDPGPFIVLFFPTRDSHRQEGGGGDTRRTGVAHDARSVAGVDAVALGLDDAVGAAGRVVVAGILAGVVAPLPAALVALKKKKGNKRNTT